MLQSNRCRPYIESIEYNFFMNKIFKISDTPYSERSELYDEAKDAISERVAELLDQGIIQIQIDEGAHTVVVKRENCEIVWPAYKGD